MALRQIRKYGDPILEKPCREVKELTPRLQDLIDDMLETMYDAAGVGLAAPQVGVLRRIVVIDVNEEEGQEPLILINPVITESDGEQTGQEGCLSVPGKAGDVTRPEHVIVKALNEKMEEIEVEGTGLLARALCHELDHLDGVVYVSKVNGELYNVEESGEEADEEAEEAEEKAEEETQRG